MFNIISVNFYRIRKKPLFWVLIIVTIVLSVIAQMINYFGAIEQDEVPSIEAAMFAIACGAPFTLAILISLIIGSDYSDGTLRNRIIMGYTRTQIYLANQITASLVSIILSFVWLIPAFAMGVPLMKVSTSWNTIFCLIGMLALEMLAYSAIVNFISMLITSKAGASIMNLIVVLVMMLVGLWVYVKLSEPQYYSDVFITAAGEARYEEIENSAYVHEGPVRTFLEGIRDFTPAGQQFLLFTVQMTDALRRVVSDIVIMLGLGFVGARIFERKNLK